MTTLMYVHGYGSDGNAMKGRMLREMLPECRVVSPTLDYDGCSPDELLEMLQKTVEAERVEMIVGSSMGGYFGLCCAHFFEGPMWLINPVHHIVPTLELVVMQGVGEARLDKYRSRRLMEYKAFDKQVFAQVPQRKGQLNFALSEDDELLGDHHDLMEMFPQHGEVVWMAGCGHRFLRFAEMKPWMRKTLGL